MKYLIELNGKKYEVEVEEGEARILSETAAQAAPVSNGLAEQLMNKEKQQELGAGTQITAPMPGTVITLSVQNGQKVNAGDTVVVIEALKMENDIVAPCAGTVKLAVQKDQAVDTGTLLAVIS